MTLTVSASEHLIASSSAFSLGARVETTIPVAQVDESTSPATVGGIPLRIVRSLRAVLMISLREPHRQCAARLRACCWRMFRIYPRSHRNEPGPKHMGDAGACRLHVMA
jgi:hypothetical protein